jgi:hypothetical protein
MECDMWSRDMMSRQAVTLRLLDADQWKPENRFQCDQMSQFQRIRDA